MARAPRASKTAKPKRASRAPAEASGAAGEPDTDDADEAGVQAVAAPENLVGELTAGDGGDSVADDGALPAEWLPPESSTEGMRSPPLAPSRDPVRRFIDEARHHPRLSDEEERALIDAARGHGDLGAARKLVVHNLRLVVSLAYQYRRAWTNVLDLFQEGSVGLMEAVKRWDPSFGTRFGTYAAYWIRAYILRFLMMNARLIHVGNTRAGRKLFFRLEKERQKLLAGGFEVTPKLLAAKLDVAEKDLEEVSSHLASREVSFEPRPDGEGVALEERVSNRNQASPEDEAARAQLSHSVRVLSDEFEATLTDARERAVWREHLASTDEPQPLSALGERFGVSKQRMGQIADRLKKRFRDQLLATMGRDIQMAWQEEQDI